MKTELPEDVKELAGRIARAHALLSDPQPGISSWWQCVGEELKAIAAEYAKGGGVSA